MIHDHGPDFTNEGETEERARFSNEPFLMGPHPAEEEKVSPFPPAPHFSILSFVPPALIPDLPGEKISHEILTRSRFDLTTTPL